MGSPYKAIQKRQEDVDIKAEVEDLEVGTLYPITGFKTRPSNWEVDGRKPVNLIVNFKLRGMRRFIYMPTAYNDLSQETLDFFKKDINNGTPANLVYYGKLGGTKQLCLQEYGESVDEDKGNMFKASQDKALKRKNNEEDVTPTKNRA